MDSSVNGGAVVLLGSSGTAAALALAAFRYSTHHRFADTGFVLNIAAAIGGTGLGFVALLLLLVGLSRLRPNDPPDRPQP